MEEESIIYELLHSKYIYEYREELLKEDNNFAKWVREARAKLEKTLSDDEMKLVDNYKYDICLREDYIDYQVGIRILNYGIKIGTEISKAFFKIENEE